MESLKEDKDSLKKDGLKRGDEGNHHGKNDSASWFGALEVVSFLCGAAVMVLEMAGSRVVAPYMGTSTVVWTSLIGVIMASLSIGYWLGGVVADKKPERRVLARIIMLAALSVAVMALIANPVLAYLSDDVGSELYVTSVMSLSVVAALILFAVPSLLLGMVSPFVVRLAVRNVGSSGATVGRFSALSSAGSILGTFLGGFVLISFFPSGTILFIIAALLAFTSLILFVNDWRTSALLLILCIIGGAATQVWGLPDERIGEHIDTRYNHIWIAETIRRSSDRRVRVMMTDPTGAQSVVYTDDPTELVSDYTKFYDLAFYYNPGAKKILMLGGGAYCVPRHLMATKQDVSVDVVEIDPGITQAARDFFYLKDDPRIAIFHEDARMFLNRTRAERQGTYDAVFEDVFGSWYSIPFHLTTVEAMRRMYDLLSPNGVMISNVISALYGPRSGVFHGIYSSVAAVFPRVLIFPASAPDPQFAQSRQNIMIVAFKSAGEPPVLPPHDPETSRLISHRWSEPFKANVPAFVDDFAPVERYSLMQ